MPMACLNGYTTDERFAHLNFATQVLCTMAWQAIEKDRIEDLFWEEMK